MNKLASDPTPALETDALDALTGVQEAVREMLGHLPGPFEKPSQLQHCLDVDPKVAWHLFKLVTAADPLAGARHVPGQLTARRLGRAAARRGVPSRVVTAMQRAILEFDAIVKQHASNRSSFKAIVATVAGERSAEVTALQQRHAAFNSESQLWGEQIGLYLQQAIVTRADADHASVCAITLKSGVQLLRTDSAPVLEGYRVFAPGEPIPMTPLEPEAFALYGTSLLPGFCSQPVPEFDIEERSDGWRYSVLRGNRIGRQGAVDLAFGRRVEFDPISTRRDGTRAVIHGMSFKSPTAHGVLEMLVHRASFKGVLPTFGIFGDVNMATMEGLIDNGRRLPGYTTLQPLGPADASAPPAGLPGYHALQHHVFDRLGRSQAEFDLYRVTMSYPMLHTTAVVWFTL